jgi:hypothetical protein
MKKAFAILMTTTVLAAGFSTLSSVPAKAANTCFRECRDQWRACTDDPCSCVTIFEACVAECQ